MLSIQDRCDDSARSVIKADQKIDLEDVEIEEDCLNILALHQPVAIDLRFIIAVLKINNDRERIGDLAANIARRALRINQAPAVEEFFDCGLMADKAIAMLRQGVDALVNMDLDGARQVCDVDDEVDLMNSQMYDIVEKQINEDHSRAVVLLLYLSVSSQLERIADHATSIAQDVIYMITGDIVRHGADALRD